jgi:hypothetical protein
MISGKSSAGSGLFSSMGKFIALLTIMLASYQVKAFTDQCTYKQLPIFVGGASDEHVNCLVFDPATQMVIMGGNTTSVNFAPAGNDHAFLIGVDYFGNW